MNRCVCGLLACVLLANGLLMPTAVCAQEITEQQVLDTIQVARQALLREQQGDGSWEVGISDVGGMRTGGTALVTLALLNAGVAADDPKIKLAVKHLREVDEPNSTYAISLMLMVFSIVKEPRDRIRMASLVRKLEDGQIDRGEMAGCWGYTCGSGGALGQVGGGDRSNGQFAVLGLYEAAQAGIPVRRDVWERARAHWSRTQEGDGGWGYSGGAGSGSTGSMTVAGIATLVMTSAMLQEDDPTGKLDCCAEKKPDEALERGLQWLTSHFAVGNNPGAGGWLLYYLYGLERAGRLSGQRFFGEHDWYREGARFLVRSFGKGRGLLAGAGGGETNPVIGTSFALLFLSKGLAPVLINKLQFQSDGNDKLAWNHHTYDIRNLTDRISGADRWPKLVTWQTVDMKTVVKHGSVAELRQSPVLYLCGPEAPQFTDQEMELLRQYVDFGGFILAVNACDRTAFRDGIFDLVQRMYPKGETSLERLKPDHPVFKAEHPLDGKLVELWGADLGCRTAIMYSPDDVACLWNKWSRQDPPKRTADMRLRIERAMQVGVNIVAYATGREPPNKLQQMELASEEGQADNLQRGLLQVAQIRHAGGWDTAPKAARNLLLALNRTVGLTASTRPGAVALSDPKLFDYSLLVMHGRHRFDVPDAEVERLREYLLRGRVLFADACCGAPQFDRSFRRLMEQLFPGKPLTRIAPEHELFSVQVGHDLRKVRRRSAETSGVRDTLEGNIIVGEPFLEGIEIDGRLVVIYSKYDISCALERQASLACSGYLSEDAVMLAVNIVLYSLLQDVAETGVK